METPLGHQQHGQRDTLLCGLLTDQAAELGSPGQLVIQERPGTAVEFGAMVHLLVREHLYSLLDRGGCRAFHPLTTIKDVSHVGDEIILQIPPGRYKGFDPAGGIRLFR